MSVLAWSSRGFPWWALSLYGIFFGTAGVVAVFAIVMVLLDLRRDKARGK